MIAGKQDQQRDINPLQNVEAPLVNYGETRILPPRRHNKTLIRTPARVPCGWDVTFFLRVSGRGRWDGGAKPHDAMIARRCRFAAMRPRVSMGPMRTAPSSAIGLGAGENGEKSTARNSTPFVIQPNDVEGRGDDLVRGSETREKTQQGHLEIHRVR